MIGKSPFSKRTNVTPDRSSVSFAQQQPEDSLDHPFEAGIQTRSSSASSLQHETTPITPSRDDDTVASDSTTAPSSTSKTPFSFRPKVFRFLPAYTRFDLQNYKTGGKDETPVSEILLTHSVDETDRETLYHLDLLHTFRQRLRLNAALALLLIPLFQLHYSYLIPKIASQVLVPHGMMMALCAGYLFFSGRLHSLVWARILTLIGYFCMCFGAALVAAIISQFQITPTIMAVVQLTMLVAHSQILLSVVLLPLTLRECFLLAVVVTASLLWSSLSALPTQSNFVQVSQLFVLLTTTVFVAFVTYFQAALRRQAFDATFDVARTAAQLQTLSTHDAVTGGFNRLYLEHALEQEINRAARFSRPLSVLMFDLDNFKNVNDTMGHTIGDEVLRLVEQATTVAIRDVDKAARYGGDEFIIILPETESAGAVAIAERVQEFVHEKLFDFFETRTRRCNVTVSIGIVTLHPIMPLTVENVIALADERLYEAKRLGKNRIVI